MILGYTDEDLTDDVHSELCREYLHPVYTTQPVVKRLYNRFDNRLYRVNGALGSLRSSHGNITLLQTVNPDMT